MASKKIASVGSTKSTAKKSMNMGKGMNMAAMPIALKPAENDNVSVRPIMNGFIVSHSGSRGKGAKQQYFNKEYHSPTNPIKFGKK